MNTLNRFHQLDENYNYECNDNVNSFKPMKKSTPFKTTTPVQDITTTEFKFAKELFPSLTKSVQPVTVPASLSFSKLITTKEYENTEVPPKKEEEPDSISEGYYVTVFNKKTRVLVVMRPNKVQTEEKKDVQVELFKEANQVLQKLNELHIRRSKEYLFTWGEDEFIRTFLSERDVESAPIFFKTS
jgi:hypothetical protein